ncbi:MAG: UTP--glucose-phosphate uridylyltransferase, partial [Myxococcaceae bacterium]|nr:UTP--glucose-phosphate uridylyltransferase [Myxococcaceae bacterium]
QVTCFAQSISLRLSADGQLFRDQAGRPSPYAPGHGDMTFALADAGLLARLQREGVRYLYVSNVDNLAASLDPSVIGAHLEGQARMTFEVAPLGPGDQGGVPARLAGRLQVIEALRYPAGFVESSIPWFSINSFVLDIAGLEPELPLEWFRVSKQVDGRAAVQFERFVNQLTAFVPSRALAIEREGLDCRFLPVKDPNDLRARLPLIRTLLESRRTL